MILVDHEIRKAVEEKRLTITDFKETCLQPASYDLRIGQYVYSPTSPESPINLSTNGQAWRLPPYGMAVLTTHEDLGLPDNLAGRIGLKSGFARKGIFASTGPQIDPGFRGKLFVSVFNLTAASHILEYLDTFLTIEFHELDSRPERPYAGQYQDKYKPTSEVMDSLVRLEGLNLNEIQTQFTELARHFKEWSELAPRFNDFLQEMKDHTRAIAQLIERSSVPLTPAASIALRQSPRTARKISHKQAAQEILALFQEKKRLYYSDIAEALNLDFGTVIRVCDELKRQGLIDGDSNGKRRTQRTKKTRN